MEPDRMQQLSRCICALMQGRRGHSMISYQDYIFLFGGIQDVTKEKNDVHIYHPGKN